MKVEQDQLILKLIVGCVLSVESFNVRTIESTSVGVASRVVNFLLVHSLCVSCHSHNHVTHLEKHMCGYLRTFLVWELRCT